MAEVKPEPPPRPATTPSITTIPAFAVRQRFPSQPSTRSTLSPSRKPPELLRRRSSILSYSSFEDASQSFADEIINPRTGRRNGQETREVTHWHSTPLAFAILPAVGGLLFKNGSAFVTDALLLTLAAIFMNWSIRLPWDWYYSAQAVRQEVDPDDTPIIEEAEGDEIAVETASSATDGPSESDTAPRGGRSQAKAASDLRQQELLALLATFVLPAMAAYLLHVIRAQLSRPSTNLVSDYNLTIFLLAAEIRPCRQLVRLLANRTLHLQRLVTGMEDPFISMTTEQSIISNLTNRVMELEARLSKHTVIPPNITIAQKTDISELSSEMRKRYEPRLDGLERAVRRYEKRSTTLAMLTEQRLQSLETRLQDALSLAAVAAQHSQRRGLVAYALETSSWLIALPMKLAWTVCIWPLVLLEDAYDRVKAIILGPMPPRPSKSRLAPREGTAEEKGKVKGVGRKPLR